MEPADNHSFRFLISLGELWYHKGSEDMEDERGAVYKGSERMEDERGAVSQGN